MLVVVGQLVWAVLFGQVCGLFRLRGFKQRRKQERGKVDPSSGTLSIKIDQDIHMQGC